MLNVPAMRRRSTPNLPDSPAVRLGPYQSDDRLRRDLVRAAKQPSCQNITADWHGVPLEVSLTPVSASPRVRCDAHAAVVVIDSRLSARDRADHVESAIDYIQHLRARFGSVELV